MNNFKIRTFCSRHDGHADVLSQFSKSFDDAFNLNGFCSQIFLIIIITNLTLPAGRVHSFTLLILSGSRVRSRAQGNVDGATRRPPTEQ
jgi:hypothetical protein